MKTANLMSLLILVVLFVFVVMPFVGFLTSVVYSVLSDAPFVMPSYSTLLTIGLLIALAVSVVVFFLGSILLSSQRKCENGD